MRGILIDEDGDVKIDNGSLSIGECSADVAERVLVSHPGEFKETPTIGMFSIGQQNGKPDPFWRGEAKRQLKQMGVDLKEITIDNKGQIMVEIR